MPSFTNLLIVMAVAFSAPLVLGLFPRLQLPSVVVEIVAGFVIGPSVLGGGLIDTPLLVAIILCATSLGVLVPVLREPAPLMAM